MKRFVVASACVIGRVPLGGFHNYVVIISNARGLRPDNSRSTLNFPEIAPSDLRFSALGVVHLFCCELPREKAEPSP